MLKGKTIVLGVTGSIAAYKMANVASMLVKRGCEVHVVMTKNATHFINPIAFESLTNTKCLVETFDRNFQFHVAHVSLTDKADAMLIAPASANIIGKIANGIADGILKTLGIKPKTNNTTAQAASGEVPSVKSDSAKSTEIMPAACEKKPAPPAKPACNCDDDLSPEPLYRVQVGAYRNKNNADRMLNSLLIEGFPAFIIYENDYYKVQVGAFRQLSNAIKMEQKLRKFRYNTYIVYS